MVLPRGHGRPDAAGAGPHRHDHVTAASSADGEYAGLGGCGTASPSRPERKELGASLRRAIRLGVTAVGAAATRTRFMEPLHPG